MNDVCMYVCVCMYVRMYVCNVCMYVCIYIYIDEFVKEVLCISISISSCEPM